MVWARMVGLEGHNLYSTTAPKKGWTHSAVPTNCLLVYIYICIYNVELSWEWANYLWISQSKQFEGKNRQLLANVLQSEVEILRNWMYNHKWISNLIYTYTHVYHAYVHIYIHVYTHVHIYICIILT